MALLLGLPLELRLKILDYAIIDKKLFVCLDRPCIHHYCFDPLEPLNRNAKLLMISKKINEELKLRIIS